MIPSSIEAKARGSYRAVGFQPSGDAAARPPLGYGPRVEAEALGRHPGVGFDQVDLHRPQRPVEHVDEARRAQLSRDAPASGGCGCELACKRVVDSPIVVERLDGGREQLLGVSAPGQLRVPQHPVIGTECLFGVEGHTQLEVESCVDGRTVHVEKATGLDADPGLGQLCGNLCRIDP